MNPIADLSYRNYDGPLLPPANRWWAIARMTMQMAMGKKIFWVCACFIALPYLLQMFTFYVMDTFASGLVIGAKNPLIQQIIWKDRFLDAFSYAQLFYLLMALVVGAGAIANDNHSNALLVYLSKPCTKLDYVLGKWLGSFLLFSAVTLVPTLVFYGYCFMGYRDYGFYTEDPQLIFKVIAMSLVPGAVHASLTVGVSSLFNQGRLAGAAYAGAYFIPLFVTKAIQIAINVNRGQHVPTTAYRLFYGSIDGIQIGLAKFILGTDGSNLFRGGGRPGGFMVTPPPAPPSGYILALALIPCAICIGLAWWRVRAVEVVG